MKKLLLLICSLASTASFAQDTLRVGDGFAHYSDLEFGTYKTVNYVQRGGTYINVSLKTYTTEEVQINGESYLSFRHEWASSNPKQSGSFHYLCKPETLEPVQHIRFTDRRGKEAFKFLSNQIIGLDSASDNYQKDFSLALERPTFNWEIDLEMYSLLPMKEGRKLVLNVYHPGGRSAPKYMQLEVTGSEKINLPNGKSLDCWILYSDYGGEQPTQFWYTKKGQNFVKMESEFQGMKIRKVRLF